MKVWFQIDFPVWINADIVTGPLNGSQPVDPTAFLQKASSFSHSTLSIGWTTTFTPNTKISYTDEQISEMLKEIRENNVTQPITFPVRAAIAAESITQMQHLLGNVSSSTLTIWSSVSSDTIDIDNLRELIKVVGVDKTYLDLPDAVLEALHLDTIGGSVLYKPVTMMIVATVLFLTLF